MAFPGLSRARSAGNLPAEALSAPRRTSSKAWLAHHLAALPIPATPHNQ